MSRTRSKGKSPGYEYWSRRAGNAPSPGRETKKITHGKERARAKDETRKDLADLYRTERSAHFEYEDV